MGFEDDFIQYDVIIPQGFSSLNEISKRDWVRAELGLG